MLDVIYNEDCLEGMKRLPDGSVQCCVTSPPYYGLRDYGTAKWDGGDGACDHSKGTAASKKSTLKNDGRPNPGSNHYEHSVVVPYRAVCGKCGAARVDDQIGLEESPEAYVSKLVAVFREVRRVLKADGTLWLNLGDSYAMSTKGSSGKGEKQRSNAGTILDDRRWQIPCGLKPKDLIGIPWRVAFALQADGWYLRQDIIWHKPNPMPESVRDRCTKAHEYVFLLSKSPKYFYDAESLKEPCSTSVRAREKHNGESAVDTKLRGYGSHCGTYLGGRNKRSVWTITPKPFKSAHFAVMPEALIEPCILAGSKVGSLILDPFMGAGTVALVAARLQRQYVGFELNADYCRLAEQRLTPARQYPLAACG